MLLPYTTRKSDDFGILETMGTGNSNNSIGIGIGIGIGTVFLVPSDIHICRFRRFRLRHHPRRCNSRYLASDRKMSYRSKTIIFASLSFVGERSILKLS